MIKLSAFRWVPPFAQGLVRDLPVRWALEEAGTPYEEMLIGPDEQASAAYRALQPFGQVPAIETASMKLFESGAIVLHIASQSEILMPSEPVARARALAWVFAAQTTLDPHVQAYGELVSFDAAEPWAEARKPALLAAVERRLDAVETWLGDRDYLEEHFTVGDLVMTTILRNLRDTNLMDSRATLRAHGERCQARPAFQRALAAHMRPFLAHSA